MRAQGLLSAEEAERQRRAEEREAQQAQLEQEQREQAAVEKAAEEQMFGVVRRSPQEFLAQIAAIDAAKERAAARREAMGLPPASTDTFGAASVPAREPRPWRPTPWELRQNQAEREAAKQSTPATKADVERLEGEITHAKALAHSAQRAQAEAYVARRTAAAQPDDGLRYRYSGDGIVGGPY
jgi:hypothetical protein